MLFGVVLCDVENGNVNVYDFGFDFDCHFAPFTPAFDRMYESTPSPMRVRSANVIVDRRGLEEANAAGVMWNGMEWNGVVLCRV